MSKIPPLREKQPDIWAPQAPTMERMLVVGATRPTLLVHIEKEEHNEIGSRLGVHQAMKIRLENEIKDLKAKYKEDISAEETAIKKLAKQLETWAKPEEVDVEEIHDYTAGVGRFVRADTNREDVDRRYTLTAGQMNRSQGVLAIGLTGDRPHSDHNAVADAIEAEVASARPPSDASDDDVTDMRTVLIFLNDHAEGSATPAQIAKALDLDRDAVERALEMARCHQLDGEPDPYVTGPKSKRQKITPPGAQYATSLAYE